MQPVKIVDPHLVSSFFDNYKRVYLHTTIELVNKSAIVAECFLNIQVATEVEGNTCLVEHLQTQNLSLPAGAHVHYTFSEVSFLANYSFMQFSSLHANWYFDRELLFPPNGFLLLNK